MKPATRTLPHKVYRCYDADDRLIYVGMTSLPLQERFRVHQQQNPRVVADTARVEVAEYPNRSAAAEAESRAIDIERPLYNVRRGTAWEPTEDDMRAAANCVRHLAPVKTKWGYVKPGGMTSYVNPAKDRSLPGKARIRARRAARR